MKNMETTELKDLYLSIISIVLNGDFAAFSILKKQLPNLEIENTSGTGNSKTVCFSIANGDSPIVDGSESNMEILDTRLVLESSDVVFVKLIVLGGLIKTLIIGGGNIQKKSDIKSHFWSCSFSPEISVKERCLNAKFRNFEKAIGYYPSYK